LTPQALNKFICCLPDATIGFGAGVCLSLAMNKQ
jgi:hypothetical protein